MRIFTVHDTTKAELGSAEAAGVLLLRSDTWCLPLAHPHTKKLSSGWKGSKYRRGYEVNRLCLSVRSMINRQ